MEHYRVLTLASCLSLLFPRPIVTFFYSKMAVTPGLCIHRAVSERGALVYTNHMSLGVHSLPLSLTHYELNTSPMVINGVALWGGRAWK